MAARGSTDPGTLSLVAAAALRVGWIEYQLGRKQEAATALRRAVEEYNRVTAELPTVAGHRAALAMGYAGLSRLEWDSGRYPEAEGHLRQALSLMEKLAEEFPGAPSHRLDLSQLHITMTPVLFEQNKVTEAEREIKASLDLLKRLVSEFANVVEYREALAAAHMNAGSIKLQRGGFWAGSGAENDYRQALSLIKQLVAESPTGTKYYQMMAMIHGNLASALKTRGKVEAAVEEYRRGASVLEQLVADYPAAPIYRVTLGGMYSTLGKLLLDGGKPTDSLLPIFERAVNLLDPIHRTEPGNVEVKKALGIGCAGRARVYEQLGKHEQAIRDWDQAIEVGDETEVIELRAYRAISKLNAGRAAEAVADMAVVRKARPPRNGGWGPRGSGLFFIDWRPHYLYSFACIYSVASAQVSEEKQNYCNRAMEFLDKAVKAKFNDVNKLKTDKQLDPLRDRSDIKKLVADLEAKFPPREVLPTPRADK